VRNFYSFQEQAMHIVSALKRGINEGKVIMFEEPSEQKHWIGEHKYALAHEYRAEKIIPENIEKFSSSARRSCVSINF
jgi:hypothetical protein